jgi:poly-gamma-glutamate synthesis protein (capsule biosynthesis protein)
LSANTPISDHDVWDDTLSLRIVIGSDICPTAGDFGLFEQGNIGALLPPDFVSLFNDADFSIVNAECPLTHMTTKIPKDGPALKASPQCVNLFRALGVTAVCLANNHILDYGEDGVKETLATFSNAGIRTVGAGVGLGDARTPLHHHFSCGRSLGVVAMAESEFSIAGIDSAGANPIDFANYTTIRNLKKNTDKVLLILHAGTEMRRIPRPGLIDLCHFLIDQGADAVIVQHTHCVGGVEYYNNAPIIYGQGNFIFGKLSKNDIKTPLWWEGMHVELDWDTKSNHWTLMLHPFLQRSEGVGIRILTDPEREEFWKNQNDFSKIIKDRDEVERSWQDFCSESKDSILLDLMGASRIPRALAYRGLPLVRLWLLLIESHKLHNTISCESHRELALDILKRLPKTILSRKY